MEIRDLLGKFQKKERGPKEGKVLCRFPLDLKPDQIRYFPSPSHKGVFKWAVDIGCEERDRILSPVDGIVIDLKQSSYEWKKYREFSGDPNEYLNWITIQLTNKRGEATNQTLQLCHIMAHSCGRIVGDSVKKGEEIAKVGINGVITTTGDGEPDVHLHIVAFEGKDATHPLEGFNSVKIAFDKREIPDPYSVEAYRWLKA